jgi:hypothetical protein
MTRSRRVVGMDAKQRLRTFLLEDFFHTLAAFAAGRS